MKTHSEFLTTARAADMSTLVTIIPDFPKPGILFRDAGVLLHDRKMFGALVGTLTAPYFVEAPATGRALVPPDVVVGIEARGFPLGGAMAYDLNAGFVSARKVGKLGGVTKRVSYALEYGAAEIEMAEGLVQPGERVLIHDDLLATGGTALAAAQLVQMMGGVVIGFCFVIELEALDGRARLLKAAPEASIHCILTY